jgi:hypothetical protein
MMMMKEIPPPIEAPMIVPWLFEPMLDPGGKF